MKKNQKPPSRREFIATALGVPKQSIREIEFTDYDTELRVYQNCYSIAPGAADLNQYAVIRKSEGIEFAHDVMPGSSMWEMIASEGRAKVYRYTGGDRVKFEPMPARDVMFAYYLTEKLAALTPAEIDVNPEEAMATMREAFQEFSDPDFSMETLHKSTAGVSATYAKKYGGA